LTYPRDYRQERTYGCSGTGVIIALVLVVAIMLGVVFLAGNTIFYFFPFIDPSQIEWVPEPWFAMSAYIINAIITVAVTFTALIGYWLYRQSRQVDYEGQQISDVENQ